MKYKIKKCLSIMLTLCMVLSLLSGATVTANADGGGDKAVCQRRGYAE